MFYTKSNLELKNKNTKRFFMALKNIQMPEPSKKYQEIFYGS